MNKLFDKCFHFQSPDNSFINCKHNKERKSKVLGTSLNVEFMRNGHDLGSVVTILTVYPICILCSSVHLLM